jgi:small-conductance mechanosensitive channel
MIIFMVEWFKNLTFSQHIWSSIFLLIFLLLFKYLVTHQIQNSKMPREVRRRWLINIRNWSTLLIILGLAIIWSAAIHNFALSLAAIAVAMVLATKELILCILGGILKASSQPFKMGDRVEIDGMRGDIIGGNLLVTQILEIGPDNLTHQYTGRSISLPNSLFLSKPVLNESFMHKYVLHVFKVPLKDAENWKVAEEIMLKAANHECEPFLKEASTHMEEMGNREGLQTPETKPRVTFALPNNQGITMIVRIPSPATGKGMLEQKVLRRFLEAYYEQKK